MKTREQAEQRANELFPKVEGNDHLWTSRVVVEKEIKAFLQCWEEMQLPKIPQEAEARALELYPKTHIATVNQLHEISREAYLQGWVEAQQDKQTCGFCVNKK